MSGHDLIDDYLSELMDDPGKGKPGAAARAPTPTATPAPAPDPAAPTATEAQQDKPTEPAPEAPGADPLAAFRHGSPQIGDDEFEAMLDVLHGTAHADPASDARAEPATADRGDPLAGFREGGDDISEDEFEAMLDALQGAPQTRSPAAAAPADPLAEFRQGGDEISEDEFEAMLDAMQGKPASAAAPAPPVRVAAAQPGDPLAAFREGSEEISEDEFEAMLDAIQGSPAAASAAAAAPAPATSTLAAAPTPRPAASASSLPARAIEALLPPSEAEPAPGEPALPSGRRRRAEDRVTSWLRFNLARQCFAVEVLKVQEVLRVPQILPVRGTDEATLGVMNLRGQIVPVMDLAIRLGFPPTEPNEASRVIVLEEKGETLGLLVASVADVLNLSEGRMERISGTPSLVAAEVVRGVSRRDEQIVIMLDASRLLA
jgi:purine-binding chemotaxis protein CheW